MLKNRQKGRKMPELVEGIFILMEIRDPVPELAEGQYSIILTAKIDLIVLWSGQFVKEATDSQIKK